MTRLLWLFPRDWRDRYGDQVEDMLRSSDTPVRNSFDVVRAAVLCRLNKLCRLTKLCRLNKLCQLTNALKEKMMRRLVLIVSAVLLVTGVVLTSLAADRCRTDCAPAGGLHGVESRDHAVPNDPLSANSRRLSQPVVALTNRSPMASRSGLLMFSWSSGSRSASSSST